MLTPTDKRRIRAEVHYDLSKILNEKSATDEEFFFRMTYAMEVIAHDLATFDDIFEKGDWHSPVIVV